MRKQKKYHLIYKTTNLLSGKYYIGMHSTNNLDDGYMGSGRRLRYSINKHGKDNHKVEILEYCNSREELKNREIDIVTLNEIAKIDCMNLKVGGEGGFISDEQQRHRSQCGGRAHVEKLKSDDVYKERHNKTFTKNRLNWINSGKHNFKTFEGKTHSSQTKVKMSETKKGQGKGENNSQYGSSWITNESENKKIKRGDFIPEGWRLGRVIIK